jgi:Ca2+-binding RTX toxin-like protein/quercetin dioxygenase-like cupin family protein
MEGHHDSPNTMESNAIDITSPEGLETVKEIFKAQNISPDVPPDSSREQIWLSGNLDTFLATSEDTNGQYALFDLYVPPLAGPVPHFHTREDEVYQVLDGNIVFQEGTQIREVAPGDLIPLHRGHLHRFENLGTEPARLLLLATPAGLDQFFREAGQPVTDPSEPPPKDDIAKVMAAAAKQGIEVYPEASLIGKPIVNDGGIALYGDQSDETIVGTNGSDLIIGRNGKDQLKGDLGNDILIGGTSDDQLDGGQGNDLLSGREGNDTLTGGGDQDTFLVRLGGSIDTITDFGGVGTGVNPSAAVIAEVDTLQFEGPGLSARNMILNQDGSDLQFTFEGIEQTGVILKDFALENLDNLSKATGASVNIGNILFDGQTQIEDSFDVFNANQQRSTVFNKNSVTFLNDLDNNTQGFNGSNDVINGQDGNDKLEGLSGDDLLRGGAGNDTLIGSSGNDTLNGSSGDDLLRGGAGNDIFIGGAGNDTLIGHSGRDQFLIAAGAGTDTIADFTSGKDLIELSGGLEFSDLTLAQGTDVHANDTFLSLTSSNELLAILTGVQASTLNSANFSIA